MNIKKENNVGYYVCTCGLFYTLENCTCPSVVFTCSNCKRKIGGLNHKLIGKEEGQTSHFRIIKNEEEKNYNKWVKEAINDGRIPYKLFEDYKNEILNEHLKKEPKGIINVGGANFKERNTNINYIIRTLDELSFRILNYILYSHLFFSNLLGNFKDNDLKNYTQDLSCIRMIKINWEIIKEILMEKKISNIKCFMNIIFDEIIKFIKEIKGMETMEKRESFENKIKDYILKVISNKNEYEKYQKLYNQYNDNIKKTNPESFVEILLESYSPFENIYSKKEYPNLELFLISSNPNIKNMEKSLKTKRDYTSKYFLLNQVFLQNKENELIENVLNINKLVNFLYNKYNNKIERDKAKEEKLLHYFSEGNQEKITTIINPYIDSWNKIKSKCTKYLCRDDMEILDISENSELIYFLPDDGEIRGGMYLASAYRNFIDWQNNFIDKLKESINPNSQLNSYLPQLEQEIYIQDANEEDIIKINSKTLKKVEEMIMKYSMRDIFKNDKIDYTGFKRPIQFNFDEIEIELSKEILPGIKRFKTKEEDEPIRFFCFLYEAFRNNRSSIIINYNKKYSSKELSEDENIKLNNFLNKHLDKYNLDEYNTDKHNSNKYNSVILQNILSSSQILIDYIQKENFNKNEFISNILQNLPDYINIDEDLKIFFYKNEKLFEINKLINIYDLIEIKCWNLFKNNICEEYKMDIKEEIKNELKNHINSIFKEESLIRKDDLLTAIRRFISRYLTGKREDIDINEYISLELHITRPDLWRFELLNRNNESNFELEIKNIFNGIKKKFNIIVECNEKDNKCKICQKKKKSQNYNPCQDCKECNSGLRIGHAFKFYELMTYGEKMKETENDDENINDNETEGENDDDN